MVMVIKSDSSCGYVCRCTRVTSAAHREQFPGAIPGSVCSGGVGDDIWLVPTV